jgi:hypothetical protein
MNAFKTPLDNELHAARSLTERRDRARGDAVRAIRLLERRLVEALGGYKLKGLPNLAPESEHAFNAIRVRGKVSEALPMDGRAVLVLAEDGSIRMAMRYEDGGLCPKVFARDWPARDADFVAEDLEPIAARILNALENHNAHASKTAARYAEVAMLSRRITGALQP